MSESVHEMDMELIQDLEKKLAKKLTTKRYRHTLGVAYTAASLAMAHGESVKKAYLAGLLHDNAKCIEGEKKIRLCEKYGLPIRDVERQNPELLHAGLGSYLAQHEYGVEDPDILLAISSHTTGRPGMSRLEKILFIADYIESNRKSIPGLDKVRSFAFTDLDNAVLAKLEGTIHYISSKSAAMDQMTHETYAYYKKELTTKL